MKTECTPEQLEFQGLGRRKVQAAFDGGHITSDGGALLLRETDARFGITDRLAGCFSDHRRQELVEHSVLELVRQRVYGLALGYEDLNDHDDLLRDPLLALTLRMNESWHPFFVRSALATSQARLNRTLLNSPSNRNCSSCCPICR